MLYWREIITLTTWSYCLIHQGSSRSLPAELREDSWPGNSDSGYVITTPRKWWNGGSAQVCVYLTDSKSASIGGSITISLNRNLDEDLDGCFSPGCGPPPIDDTQLENDKDKDLIMPKIITLAPGMRELCDEISVPVVDDYQVNMKVEGTLGNVSVTYTKPVNIGKELHRIFVQTDKFLYKPGQLVQFRILSITGPFLEVSNVSYDKIWIESPSGTRIAQWLKKDNGERLIHLEFQLADEPEEGSFKIHVQQGQNRAEKPFQVEEFVLPRYEVIIKPPKYILGTDDKFYFTVCAKYIYGAPVKGNLELTLDNNGYDQYKVVITKASALNGCEDVEVTSEEMRVNFEEYYVYFINAAATVVEEGTGVQLEGDPVTARVYRTAIIFTKKGKEYYMKPALPFTGKVKAEYPDGSPAADEPMNVCYGDTCKIIDTDDQGLFTFVLPPESQSDMQEQDPSQIPENVVQVKAVNYPEIKSNESNWRSIMYESSYRYYGNRFYSASNSSLIIRPPLDELSCTGETSDIILPIMFAAFNQTKANLHIQVISRGQIQFMKSEEVEFVPGNLPIEFESLLSTLKPPHQGAIKGLLNINLQLPQTASPKAKIIVWYERDDKEIVADTQEVEIQKCFTNDVRLSWSDPLVQPGEQATLTLTAEPNSICSLGIVDKSVDLLSSDADDLTIDRVFDMVESAMISEYENSQVNDYDYCEKKAPRVILPPVLPVVLSLSPQTIPEVPSEEPPSAPLLEEVDALVLDAEFVIENEGQTIITKRSSPLPPRSFYSEYGDALTMFDVSGLYILTELTVETRPCKHREIFHGGQGRGFLLDDRPIALEAVFSAPQAFNSEAGPAEDTAINENSPRSYFPETWLWKLNLLASGENQQQLTLPDTITEWAGKAVCVHPQQGLGISSRAAITTFTPFFVDLTLPPTVKKGELLPVKISVFNYENQDLPVKVILETSDEYEIVSEGRQLAGLRSSCVASQDKTVHTIKIRPTAIGDINITVAAIVDEAFPQVCGNKSVRKSDTVIKVIKVEVEGFPREKTWTKYICSNGTQLPNKKLIIETPSDKAIVPDSARGWVTAVGDLLGPTLENLGSLVRMPYGCGEQNMLNFAPNIYILKYLDASDQTSNEIAQKATDFMRKGYQRELKYGRSDGSFSAFGERDASGSTWLTAFVLKSFVQARHYIQIDEDDLQKSKEWLKLRQQDNGCFESVGKVFNKGMKGGIGGSGSAVPLTAYVLISLLEAEELGSSRAIGEAANCLRADRSRDTYTQALKAYALSLGKLPGAQATVDTLISFANEDRSGMSWEVANTLGSSRSIAVETGGYAILAMMTLDAERYKEQSRKVVRWISSQRNGQGGFISTQDTVVALQAMASFEASQIQGPVEMVVTLQTQSIGTHSFTINEDNKLLQQMVIFPSLPIDMLLNLEGTGCALLQAVIRYNVPEAEPSDAFNMSVSTYTEPDKNCKTKRITACASYLQPDGQSNMAVIEVKLISGYIPEKEDLKKIVGYGSGPIGDDLDGVIGSGLIKRYEVDGNLVTFYTDEISSAYTCVSFRVTREVDVEDTKPGTVQVYDYYQNEFSVSEMYTLPPNDECGPRLINRQQSLLGF